MLLSNSRLNESSFVGRQSDRLVLENNQWYFKSREKSLEGPYDTMEHLQQAVNVYIQRLEAEEDLQQFIVHNH